MLLCSGSIEEMDKQITAWEKESISEKGNVAQNLKEKIRANAEKLDKLVSVFLDGDIERETYLQRKDLLMREKAGLLESETNFGQQRKNWVEPLRSFVLSLKEAVEIEKTSNHLEWKKFFRKSALTLKSRTKRFPYAGGNYGISQLPP